MTLYAVAAPAPLRPDPDENSPPIAQVDPTDVLTLVLRSPLGPRVSVPKAEATVQGWLTAELVPVQVSTVRLFDAPLGASNETATGRVDIIAKLATWAKVKVTKAGRVGLDRLDRGCNSHAGVCEAHRGGSRHARGGYPSAPCPIPRLLARGAFRRSYDLLRPLKRPLSRPRHPLPKTLISRSGRTNAIVPRFSKPRRLHTSTPLRLRP